MKIAYFSPLSPMDTGISDYSEELLPALANEVGSENITLVVDGYAPTNTAIVGNFRVAQDSAYVASEFDIAVYQMGNSPAHGYIYKRALRAPGVVVLHELVLHHLVAWLTLNHGDRAGYVEAMREAYGEEGAVLAEREILGTDALNRFDYPLSERLIRSARGVIAHSEYVAQAVLAIAPDMPVAMIPHEMPLLPLVNVRAAREKLRLSENARLIGSFGNLGPMKRTTVLLDAFRTVRAKMPEARLVLVGAASPNFDVEGLLDVFGVRGAVDLPGHVPLADFQLYMAAMDVCVNLRYPTAGETSGAVLRMMAQSKAVIVSRTGWFAELPDDAVAKIDVDDVETEMLGVLLERLLRDEPLRAAMGQNARAYVERVCRVEDAAHEYAEFMRGVAAGNWRGATTDEGRRRTKDKGRTISDEQRNAVDAEQTTSDERPVTSDSLPDWRDEVTRAYVGLGLGETDETLRAVARAVTDLGLGE